MYYAWNNKIVTLYLDLQYIDLFVHFTILYPVSITSHKDNNKHDACTEHC